MDWSDKMDRQLKDGLADRLSASLIAEKIGHGITRNAVLGRIFRLGLTGSGRPAVQKKSETRKRATGRPRKFGSKKINMNIIKWENEAENLKDMRDMGMTFAEIGEALGINGQHVRIRMIEMGLHTPFELHYFTEKDIEYICQAWADHVPVEDIADKLGRSFGVIRQKVFHLKRAGRIDTRKAQTTRILKRYGLPESVDGMSPDEMAQQILQAQVAASLRVSAEILAAKNALKNNAIAAMHQRIMNDVPRDEAIFLGRASGLTLEQIAEQFGLTRERVRQICVKYAQEMALKEFREKNSGNLSRGK